MSDLIERLLNELTLGDAGIVITEPLCQEAADRIAALEARVAELEEALEEIASNDYPYRTPIEAARAALKGSSHE